MTREPDTQQRVNDCLAVIDFLNQTEHEGDKTESEIREKLSLNFSRWLACKTTLLQARKIAIVSTHGEPVKYALLKKPTEIWRSTSE